MVDITFMIPAAPDLQTLPSGSTYVELLPGLDLVVEEEDGALVAAVTWWGAELRRVEVGKA